MALGPNDWALGGAWVVQMAQERELPVLAANLRCDGQEPFAGHKVLQVAGRRIGVVGVTYGAPGGCEVTDAAAAVREELAAMGEVDLAVGLLPAVDIKDLGATLEKAPGLDVVFDGRGRHSHAMPEKIHDTWVYGAGSRGKALGLLRLEWTPGGEGWAPPVPIDDLKRRLANATNRKTMAESRAKGEADPEHRKRWERQAEAYARQIAQLDKEIAAAKSGDTTANLLRGEEIPLNRDVPDHAATRALVDETKDRMSAATGRPQKALAAHVAPAGSPYAGAQACRGCHPAEYVQWASTPHATALQSLVADKRHLDEQCFRCHVTGAGQPGGPASAAEVGGMRDVQCEACHGPARAHVERPDDAAVRPSQPDEALCRTCHDAEQDMGRFDPATYLPRVVHRAGAPSSEAP